MRNDILKTLPTFSCINRHSHSVVSVQTQAVKSHKNFVLFKYNFRVNTKHILDKYSSSFKPRTWNCMFTPRLNKLVSKRPVTVVCIYSVEIHVFVHEHVTWILSSPMLSSCESSSLIWIPGNLSCSNDCSKRLSWWSVKAVLRRLLRWASPGN